MSDGIVSGVLPIVLGRELFSVDKKDGGHTGGNAVASIVDTFDGIVLIVAVAITDTKRFLSSSAIRISKIEKFTITVVVVAARRVMLADTIAKLLFQDVRAIRRVVEVGRLVTVSAIITTVRVVVGDSVTLTISNLPWIFNCTVGIFIIECIAIAVVVIALGCVVILTAMANTISN